MGPLMVGVVAHAGGKHVAATQAESFPLELLKSRVVATEGSQITIADDSDGRAFRLLCDTVLTQPRSVLNSATSVTDLIL